VLANAGDERAGLPPARLGVELPDADGFLRDVHAAALIVGHASFHLRIELECADEGGALSSVRQSAADAYEAARDRTSAAYAAAREKAPRPRRLLVQRSLSSLRPKPGRIWATPKTTEKSFCAGRRGKMCPSSARFVLKK